MNENKETKMVSQTIAIALGVVCIVLAAGLLVVATNGSLFSSNAQTITELQEKVKNQTSQIATLTSQNQITIPKQVRKALGLSAGDKIRFHQDVSGDIKLKKITPIEALGGIFKSHDRGQTYDPHSVWNSRLKSK